MWLAILLIVIGIAAIYLEFFVPAGGLIGVIGFGTIVSGIVVAYRYNVTWGNITLVACLLVTPLLLYLGVRLLPHSPFARLIILKNQQTKEAGFTDFNYDDSAALLGKTGESLSILRPTGMARIDGKKYNVYSENDFIREGEKIEVIKVEGKKIVVKKLPETN